VVTAKALLAKRNQRKNFLLIDVRNSKAFNELHIPGSVNIPAHFIKTKTHVTYSPLVLIDQGLSFHRLYPICENLRKMGFNARILEGGIHAWNAQGGDLVYSSARQTDIGSVSPEHFIKEKCYPTRLVCDVSSNRSEASMKWLPYAVHLPLNGDVVKQMKMIERFHRSHCVNGFKTIILVNSDGNNYRKMINLFDRAGCKNIFYLKGGLNAYEIYLERLQRSWRQPEERLVWGGPCRECMERVLN
jgi:rhodanese-related sulfurtransferase